MVRKARRTTPDTAPPSDGSTYGDGSTDDIGPFPDRTEPLTAEELETLDALGELDELDAELPARV
jgi:hypothetical protein